MVANYAVGYDNIDVAEARSRGIEVTTTPDVLTEATADLAWALLLAAARRIGEGDRLVRSGEWDGWRPTQLLGQPVAGRTLGIIGHGRHRSGRRPPGPGLLDAGRLLQPHTACRPRSRWSWGPATWSSTSCVATADVLSLHAPLNAESRHLLDAAALARMKPTAVLVNTGRGALIDEAALVEALREGRIAAAGLDVYEREPALAEGLAQLDNVVLAPHLGSGTTTARADMVRLCADNIAAVLAGRPALTPAPGPPLSRR